MIIAEWLTTTNNKNFSIKLSDNTSIINSDTVKMMLLTRYKNYTTMYDTITDNNSLWDSYIAMIQPNIDNLYKLLVSNQTLDVYDLTETISKTDTYNLSNNIDITRAITGTQTGTDNTALSDSNTITDSGININERYAYNSLSFENNEKDTTSNTRTISDSGTNNRTLDLANSTNETTSNDTNKTGTISTSTTRNILDNGKVIDDIVKLLPINIVNNLLMIIITGFINIGAYYIGEVE